MGMIERCERIFKVPIDHCSLLIAKMLSSFYPTENLKTMSNE
jgi:hypothetical protein